MTHDGPFLVGGATAALRSGPAPCTLTAWTGPGRRVCGKLIRCTGVSVTQHPCRTATARSGHHRPAHGPGRADGAGR